MKTILSAAMMCAAFALMAGGTQFPPAHAAPVCIDTDLRSKHWMTAFTNEIPLVWEWPENAVRAELTLIGVNSSSTMNFSPDTSSFLWRIPRPTATAEEVYELSLLFYDAQNAKVDELTSRLAVVAGAFGPVTVDAVPESASWSRLASHAVIPYDAAWSDDTNGALSSELSISKIDRPTQTHELASPAGYIGWKLAGSEWGYGSFALALTFPNTEGGWNAILWRTPSGSLLSVR